MPDRLPPKLVAFESATLLAFLDYLRESVILKLQDISEDDSRRVLVPSGTTLLGLVQHLTMVEVSWFQLRFAGSDSPEPDSPVSDELPVRYHIAAYRTAARRNNEIVAIASALEQPCSDPTLEGLTLRWVLTHMVEETARHAGHADILREQIDGVTGR